LKVKEDAPAAPDQAIAKELAPTLLATRPVAAKAVVNPFTDAEDTFAVAFVASIDTV
jgi:hypothetical protein